MATHLEHPNMPARIDRVPWASHRERLTAIRTAVFVVEQKVPEHLELDGEDETAQHFLARAVDGEDIGCARLLPSGQIGRMAVLAPHRRRGVGALLLQAAVAEAKQSCPRCFLHAQILAEAFYRRAGFIPQGERFLDAGILHIEMELP